MEFRNYLNYILFKIISYLKILQSEPTPAEHMFNKLLFIHLMGNDCDFP